jgi:HTH-type transcriptional regulator / antitoxin HipB
MSQDKKPGSTRWNIGAGADFGRAIAEIRAQRHLTQAELAEQAGLSRDYLAHLEAGRSVTLLEHLLRVLRRSGATVTVSWPGDDDGQA